MKFTMSKLLIAVLMLFAFNISFGQSKVKYEEAKTTEIDQDRLNFAKTITKNILEAQSKGSFYKLDEEVATKEMVLGLDELKQKQSYDMVKNMFGNYNGITFEHMKRPLDGTLYEMYRFKGQFDPRANVEVRTVLDASGRLAGFFVLPWKED